MINRSTYYLQAPVGNRSYVYKPRGAGWGNQALRDIEGSDVNWFASGTMCLAVAVLIAIERYARKKPMVLVPAYGCPDLVSAIRFAGAEPLYVDMLPNECRMDLQLARSILASRDDVVAIIGVDLFGIPENWEGLTRLASEFEVFLIQDFAQSVQTRVRMEKTFRGDAAILSFGRGKPVCCLAGGALLTRDNIADVSRPLIAKLREHNDEVCPKLIRAKAVIYDLLLWPYAYAHLARIMGDRLGQTRYKPLHTIKFISDSTVDILDAAVANYWRDFEDVHGDIVAAIAPAISHTDSGAIRWLHNWHDTDDDFRILRLPLLVGTIERRDRLLSSLLACGISATTMYSRPLPQIVADFDNSQNVVAVPNAQALADALITLPSHARLTGNDIDCIGKTLISVSEQ